jgi:hypothetical protein
MSDDSSDVKALKPRALSTAPTLERNPFLDELFEEESKFTNSSGSEPKFHVQYQGFDSILEATYESFDDSFRVKIPYSLYSYYNWQLLFMRVEEMKRFNCFGYESQFLEETIDKQNYFADELVVKYLQGLGNVYTPDKEKMLLAPPISGFNEMGHFGKMRSNNVTAYEQIATPAILVEAMRAHFDGMNDWRPSVFLDKLGGFADVRPNRNLPGWHKPPELTREHRKTYVEMGFGEKRNPELRGRHLLNHTIMTHVNDAVAGTTSAAEHGRRQEMGSKEQFCFLEHGELHQAHPDARFTGGQVNIASPFKLTKKEMFHAFLMGYRFMEGLNLGYTAFLCATYIRHGEPAKPPDEFAHLDNRRIFDRNHNYHINTPRFRGKILNRSQILKRYCNARSMTI